MNQAYNAVNCDSKYMKTAPVRTQPFQNIFILFHNRRKVFLRLRIKTYTDYDKLF